MGPDFLEDIVCRIRSLIRRQYGTLVSATLLVIAGVLVMDRYADSGAYWLGWILITHGAAVLWIVSVPECLLRIVDRLAR